MAGVGRARNSGDGRPSDIDISFDMSRTPLMLRKSDADRIESMRQKLGRSTKVAIVREALDLLEARIARDAQVARWKRIVPKVARESARVNRELAKAHPLAPKGRDAERDDG